MFIDSDILITWGAIAKKYKKGEFIFHEDAAKHHDTDSHEKAALSTVKAEGHLALAKDAHKEIIKSQASKA